jgi:hypothetical protein
MAGCSSRCQEKLHAAFGTSALLETASGLACALPDRADTAAHPVTPLLKGIASLVGQVIGASRNVIAKLFAALRSEQNTQSDSKS